MVSEGSPSWCKSAQSRYPQTHPKLALVACFVFFSEHQETSASAPGSMIIASLPWTMSEKHWMALATKLGTRNWPPVTDTIEKRKVNGLDTLSKKRNRKSSFHLTESMSHENLSCEGIQWEHILQFSSVAQSCPTLCDPMNHSTPGLPVHHQLLEFTETHVHQVGDAFQPSHPLSSPSLPVPNPSQHQGLFQWVNSSHEVAKVLEFQLQHQSFQWTPRTDLL